MKRDAATLPEKTSVFKSVLRGADTLRLDGKMLSARLHYQPRENGTSTIRDSFSAVGDYMRASVQNLNL